MNGCMYIPNPQQTKDFVKFLSLVLILYLGMMMSLSLRHQEYADSYDLGFLTTFVLLARDHFKPQEMVIHA